jgi:hypothetical protein
MQALLNRLVHRLLTTFTEVDPGASFSVLQGVVELVDLQLAPLVVQLLSKYVGLPLRKVVSLVKRLTIEVPWGKNLFKARLLIKLQRVLFEVEAVH